MSNFEQLTKMSEKLIIFILLVVYLARPKQPDEIQISGEMKSGCFYSHTELLFRSLSLYYVTMGPFLGF